jgi:hypothetical protein
MKWHATQKAFVERSGGVGGHKFPFLKTAPPSHSTFLNKRKLMSAITIGIYLLDLDISIADTKSVAWRWTWIFNRDIRRWGLDFESVQAS